MPKFRYHYLTKQLTQIKNGTAYPIPTEQSFSDSAGENYGTLNSTRFELDLNNKKH